MSSEQDQKFHEDSNFKFPHFCLTQLLVLLVMETITIILHYRISDKFQWAFFLLPAIIAYFWILFAVAWSRDWYNHFRRIIISLSGLFIFLPIFIIVYYCVWNPTLSLKWIKSTDCNVLGIFNTKIGGLEDYGLQYVSVGYDRIGISCVSDRNSHGTHMKGYSFYHYGDLVSCDESYIQEQSQKHEDARSNNYQICKTSYTFSGVKIPTWLCQSYYEHASLEENLNENQYLSQTCYYTIYGDEKIAKENGKSTITSSGAALKDQSDIFIVRLDSKVYFFKEGFICLVLLLFYPSIIFTFQFPSSYLASRFIQYFCAFSIEQENIVLLEQEKLAQKNKESSSYVAEKPLSTSESERKRQRIEPEQINQILSPNSLLKDRDFYDIYNQTRRRQIDPKTITVAAITIEDGSINDHTTLNINHTNSDYTKMDLIPKERPNNAHSMEEIEDQNQQAVNKQQELKYQQFFEESENDLDSSYLKIRKIYKRKLDPKYQKEVQKKKKEGVPIDNEEIKVIKEIQEGMIALAEKQNKIIQAQSKETLNIKNQEEATNEQTNNNQSDPHLQQDTPASLPPGEGQENFKEEQLQELQNLQTNQISHQSNNQMLPQK